MAPLKIPVQVSCPNCQMANLPGSPYCGRCGAPLEGVVPGIPSNAPGPLAVSQDPAARFTSEGQDPGVVQQAHARASAILTAGETIEYVAVANRGNLTHAPDCAVATNKRVILYRKKVLGKLEQDDYTWRDVRSAVLKDGRGGITFALESIQGWQMSIESLPKAQAWRLYEIAVANSPRFAEALLRSTGPMDMGLAMPDMPPAQSGGADLPPLPASPVLPPASMPSTPLTKLPQVQSPPTYVEPTASVEAPAAQNPTPESVLQSILEQAARASGSPTRPMPLSAAAFQAPVADAQPVTFSDATADSGMRFMPRLNSLEQIAVFSGPLTGSLGSRHLSGEPGTPAAESQPPRQYDAKGPRQPDEVVTPRTQDYAQLVRDYGPRETEPAAPAAAQSFEQAFVDEALPLPGSLSSGPLLEAAYDPAITGRAAEHVSGSLPTQSLDEQSLDHYADRITAVNLGGRYDARHVAGGRMRRQTHAGRTPSQGSNARPSTPASPSRPENDDPVQKMKQLKEMLDAGLIDAADYEAKKADILSRL